MHRSIQSQDKERCVPLCLSSCDRVDDFSGLGPRYGEFRADYEPILARIARSHSRDRGSNGAPTRTAIVDQGSPGAWHCTSVTVQATTVACANDAEVLDGLVGALGFHKFILGLLMGVADALGFA